ncbi:MAG: DUF2207 domain-containing protein [Egibacteraceae bacterium]
MTRSARRRAPRLLGLVVAAALAVAGAAATAGPAGAQDDTGWVIESFDVVVDVRADGTIAVTEEIGVDFFSLRRRGIFRVIPARYDLSAQEEQLLLDEGTDPDRHVRAFDISDIAVSSTAPADTEITRPNRFGEHNLRIRIGDPDVTVTGKQTYHISYEVAGALNAFEEVDELNWNATGDEWPVPVLAARVVVRGQPIARAACYQGPRGSTDACAEQLDMAEPETSVGFATGRLEAGEGMTVAVGFPRGTVDVGEPILVEQWDLGHALTGSPAAVPLTGLTALLGFGGVGVLAYRRGRDRVTRGGMTVDGRPDHGEAGDGAEPARRGLFSPRPVTVQYRPPENLRPGQLGVIVDERVDPVDISATIVDFAVRGYLTIEESTTGRIRKRTDWTLTRTDKPEDGLLPFERTLLTGLFQTGSSVEMSALTGSFSSEYQQASKQLYADAVSRGWFTRSPAKTRGAWIAVGILAVLVAVGLLVAAALWTSVALAVVPLVLAAAALLVAHRWMPHRTPAGSRMLVDTLGFREFIATAEAGRMEFAEQENLFEAYLPYAIVFGEVDRWASAFAHLGAAAMTTGAAAWYVSSSGHRDLGSLSSGLSSFSNTVGSGLATTPSSSGSGGGGSSGGGGGGGGGGSW